MRPFDIQQRVLLCQHCSAPNPVPIVGGQQFCGNCGAPEHYEARRPAGPWAGAPTTDEGTRLAQLRAQDGQSLKIPESLLHLVADSGFAAAKVQEAWMVYQATRIEVKTTRSPDAAERLYVLTLLGNNHLSTSGEELRRRGLLETSLETLYLPRHQQALRATLAMASAKEGDRRSAEAWLEPCDPRALDLESDSAYRMARAYLDTVAGDYPRVLAVLGREDDEIPIADARDPTCAVLRANALERMSDLEGAVRALSTRMGKEGPGGRMAMERTIESHRQLALCPSSMPRALEAHVEQAASVAMASQGGGAGKLMLGLGALFIVGSLIYGVVGTLAGWSDVAEDALAFSFGGVLTAAIGGGMFWSGHKAAYLRRHGLRARGVVKGIQRTGTEINDVPVMEVTVTVMRDGLPPYEASFRQLMEAQLQAQLLPGVELPLRVHPSKPSEIMLEII
ncbi:MAG: zinc ribbon domain-containing protein [Myxococcales bacterium]|nr:zinc ribbon domain-containing protein [Myxococcales bacterium]